MLTKMSIISKTVQDTCRLKVSMESKYEIWYGLSNGTINFDAGVKGDLDKRGQRSPKVGQRKNSETLRDRQKVSMGDKEEVGDGLSNRTIAVITRKCKCKCKCKY